MGGPGGRGGDGGYGGLDCPASGAAGGTGGGGGYSRGGAIANVNQLAVTNATIFSSTAGLGDGGAGGQGGARGFSTCFAHNGQRGGDGGAGQAHGGAVGQLDSDTGHQALSILVGVTLAENSVPIDGGAGANLALASSGGSSHITATNSIIARPAAGTSCSNVGPGRIGSLGYNDDVGGACGFNQPTDLHSDPQLQPFGYNGGFTPTMAILRTSPVVNKGNDDSALGTGVDQRGRARPVIYPGIPLAPGGDGSDIGAFELQDEPSSVTVSIPDSPIVADGSSVATVRATVNDADGNGIGGRQVTFTSSDPGNRFGPVVDEGAGVYSVVVTSSTTAGAARITATDATASPDVSGAACCLRQIAGRAAALRLTIAPPVVVADGESHVTLSAKVVDAHENPVDGDEVAFTSDDPGHRISKTTAVGNGIYTATLIASERLGASQITATDTSVSPVVADHKTLTQKAGAAARIEVSVSPDTIPADGASTATASASVRDEGGHLLPSEQIPFSSSDPGHAIGPTVNHGDGTYTATITASHAPGPATIRATDSASGGFAFGEATLTQTLIPPNVVPVPPPAAQPDGTPSGSKGKRKCKRKKGARGKKAKAKRKCKRKKKRRR
jgi:adhesin/invasin